MYLRAMLAWLGRPVTLFFSVELNEKIFTICYIAYYKNRLVNTNSSFTTWIFYTGNFLFSSKTLLLADWLCVWSRLDNYVVNMSYIFIYITIIIWLCTTTMNDKIYLTAAVAVSSTGGGGPRKERARHFHSSVI